MTPSFWWGKPAVPMHIANHHFFVAGTTGSGKTTVLLSLLNSLIHNGAFRAGQDNRAIFFDPKREMVPRLVGLGIPKSKIVILNPFDSRCCSWDLCADISDFATAEEFASVLIPKKDTESQPYFTDAARALVAAMLKFFILKCRESPKEAPLKWTLRDLVCSVRLPAKTLEIIFQKYDSLRQYTLFLNPPKTFQSVQSTIATYMGGFEIVAALWHARDSGAASPDFGRGIRSYSLERDWQSSEDFVIIGREPAIQTTLAPLNRAFLNRAAQILLRQSDKGHDRNGKSNTWFFLDELKALQKLDYLGTIMAEGRSKGACMVLGFQERDGLIEVYGEHEANAILAQCSNQAFLRLSDPNTAEWAQRVFGERREIQVDTSDSLSGKNMTSSRSYKLGKEFTRFPSDFRSLSILHPDGGLEGFFSTPAFPQLDLQEGPLRIAARDIFDEQRGPMRTSDVPSSMPRNSRDQELKPWTADDFGRFGITEVTAGSKATLQEKGSEEEQTEALPTRARKTWSKTGDSGKIKVMDKDLSKWLKFRNMFGFRNGERVSDEELWEMFEADQTSGRTLRNEAIEALKKTPEFSKQPARSALNVGAASTGYLDGQCSLMDLLLLVREKTQH